MIHYLLYSISYNKKISQDRRLYFYGYLASLLITVISIFSFAISYMLYTVLTGIAGVAGMIVVSVLIEKHNKKMIATDYQNYNKELDELRSLLKQAEYHNPSRESDYISPKLNWYSKDKVKYLIEEFKNLSSANAGYDDSSVNQLKMTLLPVISFAGGVIADKAEFKVSIVIALLVAALILVTWGSAQILKALSDEIFVSTSDRQVKKVYSLLSDLYIRDFDESYLTSIGHDKEIAY